MADSPSRPPLTKLTRLKYSSRSFCIGVPDRRIRLWHWRELRAMYVWFSLFFNRWPWNASDRMVHPIVVLEPRYGAWIATLTIRRDSAGCAPIRKVPQWVIIIIVSLKSSTAGRRPPSWCTTSLCSLLLPPSCHHNTLLCPSSSVLLVFPFFFYLLGPI